MLLPEGYLVTNAHVVDPFDVVDVAFEDGDRHWDVPVAGVDLLTDLALLGPIDTDRDGRAIEDPGALRRRDPVYLVGFPGDQDADAPEPVVEAGTMVGHQSAGAWPLDYLEADAEIREGQSGGAMVDVRGRVVGISALDDEGNALSLAGTDANASIERMREGRSTGWNPVPSSGAAAEHSVHLDGPDDIAVLFVSGETEAEHITIEAEGPAARIAVADPGFYLEGRNAEAEAAARAGGFWSLGIDRVTVLEPDDHGALELDIEPGYDKLVLIGSSQPGGGNLQVTTSPVSFEVEAITDEKRLAVGDEVDDVVGYLDAIDTYALTLEEGDEVALTASSPSGDMAMVVADPGVTWDQGLEYDDEGGGMLDADATTSFTAPKAGVYRVLVYAADATPTVYRFSARSG